MSFFLKQGKRRGSPVQGSRPAAIIPSFTVITLLSLAGCGNQNPVMTPVGWWHDLQGGAIASDRPPPPGQNLPYPKIASIPPKPVLPSESYRDTVEDQLLAERDAAERRAARSPIVIAPVAARPPPPSAAPPPDTANAVLPGADAPPVKPGADAPAPAKAGGADGQPPVPASPPGQAVPPGTPVTIAGVAALPAGLPDIPAAPPPPATFEGLPAEPAPAPEPPVPVHLPPLVAGTPILFAPGSAVLDVSQMVTVKDAASHRGKGGIQVEGHGDAVSDTPSGQEAALALGLKRAQAVAAALQRQHVPASAIRLSATAFGRGAAILLTR